MTKQVEKPTLDRPATYQIRVPGQIGASWSAWVEGMTIAVDSEGKNENRSAGNAS